MGNCCGCRCCSTAVAVASAIVAIAVGQQSGNAFQPAYNVALFYLFCYVVFAVAVVVTLLVATYVHLPLAVACASEREKVSE